MSAGTHWRRWALFEQPLPCCATPAVCGCSRPDGVGPRTLQSNTCTTWFSRGTFSTSHALMHIADSVAALRGPAAMRSLGATTKWKHISSMALHWFKMLYIRLRLCRSASPPLSKFSSFPTLCTASSTPNTHARIESSPLCLRVGKHRVAFVVSVQDPVMYVLASSLSQGGSIHPHINKHKNKSDVKTRSQT